MHNVLVMNGMTRLSARILIGTHELTSDDTGAPQMTEAPRPIDLILAGLGGCTVASVQRYASERGWNIDGVYVELALHGQPPFQAIGRRIWLDADLTDAQMDCIVSATERSPVLGLLSSRVEVSSRVMMLPRPDRS